MYCSSAPAAAALGLFMVRRAHVLHFPNTNLQIDMDALHQTQLEGEVREMEWEWGGDK